MKKRILNLLLIVTSLLGYLEWAGGNSGYLFQLEAEIFKIAASSFTQVIHPFVLLPFFGQMVLLFTLFQKEPGKLLTFIGMGCLGLIMLMLLLIGLLGMNVRVILCALPFIIVSVLVIRAHRRRSA